jgi:cell division septation protein DedD
MIEPALDATKTAPEEDVTTTLYRAAIGPVSNNYYLPIFTRFEAVDHAGISWNTAAALSTLNWLAFRQLWGAALAYAGALVALLLLVFGIGRLVFQLSDTLVSALALGFGLAAFVLPGLFGNAVFHTECRKRMSKALVANSDVSQACAQLTRQASTRKRAIILAVANVVFAVAAVLAYLQLSALSNLTVMPQGALEAGHVAVGRAVDMAPAASTPVATQAPAPAITASQPASTPALVPASAPASAPTPVLAIASAPLPLATASATTLPTIVPAPASAPQAPASTPVAPTPRTSAPAAAIVSSSTMAMVDTMKQAAPKPELSAKPVKKAKATEVEKPQKAEPKTKPAKPEIAAKPEKNTKAPTKAADKPYFINVGLFAVAENAERAHAKLLEAQLPSTLKELSSTKGQQIRVRVGPFASKSDAQEAVKKIKALQLDAMIVQP